MSSLTLDAREAIRIKRDGGRHSQEELRSFLTAYVRDEIPDYQMASWLMAVFFNGLDETETHELTEIMLHSGQVLDLGDLPGPTVDKHSTGGVGDKISLPLAPIVAACGGFVPMISGRGLGHTGGTLDKLESIPGFRTSLATNEFVGLVRRLGLAFGGQTKELAPADGRLYALRDVTCTVESIPLIVASILSKKFASGTRRVVFDVKTGRGAFMREQARAHELATALLATTRALDREAIALITRMDDPLGVAIGNALEVREAVEVLTDRGPADVRTLTLRLAGEMLSLAGLAKSPQEGEERALRALTSGEAMERFRQVTTEQGGDARVLDDQGNLPRAAAVFEVPAAESGVVQGVNSFELGEVVVELGGGRLQKEDKIDPSVGLEVLARTGDRVEKDQPLARVHYREKNRAVAEAVGRAFEIGAEPAAARPLVIERVV